MLVRANYNFKALIMRCNHKKTHWESVRPVFAFPYDLLFYTMQEPCVARQNVGK